MGEMLLASEDHVVATQNPFDHLYRDHDVEGMTDGYDPPTAYGHIDGIDDPSMGWARYAQVRVKLGAASRTVLSCRRFLTAEQDSSAGPQALACAAS